VTGHLGRTALSQPADVVAPLLLGATLTRSSADGAVAVRITEVEAYGGVGADAASHAHKGVTPRNAVMFDKPGLLYVYFIYGMHWCANVVCGPPGMGSAVLLRAGEVSDGLTLARERRPTARSDRELARGPANLCTALSITGADNGTDLLARGSDVRLRVPRSASQSIEVSRGARVGIAREADRPWRWWIAGAPSVSRSPRRTSDTPR